MNILIVIIGVASIIFVVILGFLLGRDIMCWYWKTTKISDTLDRIEKLESEMLETLKKLEKKG